MDDILSLLQDFDVANFLPTPEKFIHSLVGWMRLIVLAGPLALLGLGVWYYFYAPKKPSRKAGFRTPWSMGSVKAWIPQGVWTDFFTGKTYSGHRVTILNRPPEQYPVLAKAGAIVPTAIHRPGSNDTANPEAMEVFVFPGADGSYALFEDDGLTDGYKEGKACVTTFTYQEAEGTFRIHTEGDTGCIPAGRTFRITFRGFAPLAVTGGQAVSYDPETRSTSVEVCGKDVLLRLQAGQAREKEPKERVRDFLRFAQVAITVKKHIMDQLDSGREAQSLLEELRADRRDARMIEVLTEILT